MSQWIKRWRLNRTTMMPEEVRLLPVSQSYVLVEGEDHTSYDGGFFATPAEAFAHEIAEADRSIRWSTDRKERVLRAQDRFEKEEG